MAPISSYAGEQLLDKNVVSQISGEAEIILRNQDIAGAWQVSRHLKTELAGVSAVALAPVLPDYRRLSANLKALALPLLEESEVTNLFQNNLGYLEKQYEGYLLAGLAVWLEAQPEEERTRLVSALKVVLPKDNPLSERLAAALA